MTGFHQGADESVCDYMDMFNQEALQIKKLDQSIAIYIINTKLYLGFFAKSLAKMETEDINEKIGKYINMEKT